MTHTPNQHPHRKVVLRADSAIPKSVKAVIVERAENPKIYLTLPDDLKHGKKIVVTNYNVPSANVRAGPGQKIVGYSKVSLRPGQTALFVRVSKSLWTAK